MNNVYVTMAGNVASEPKHRLTADEVSVCDFRLAATPGHFDRTLGRWVDEESIFMDVTCWKWLAEHVVASVHKGHPVVVHGRMSNRPYESNGFLRDAFHIDAVTIGHDLCRGTAAFTRRGRPVPESGEDRLELASRAGERPDLDRGVSQEVTVAAGQAA